MDTETKDMDRQEAEAEPVVPEEEPAKDPPKKKKTTKDLQKELDELREATEAKLAEADDQYQRLRAEYANYKRRTDQEKEQLGSFVKGETLKALLPAIDSLERAAAAPDGAEYRTGIDNTVRQLLELLKSQGLEAIEADGQPFDPELHNAVSREDAPDGVDADTVTEVYQKGYRVGDRILRPAMVKVAN